MAVVLRRRRRKTFRGRAIPVGLILVVVAGAGWFFLNNDDEPTPEPDVVVVEPEPNEPAGPSLESVHLKLVADEQTEEDEPVAADTAEDDDASSPAAAPEPVVAATVANASEAADPAAERARNDIRSGNEAINAARKLYEGGRLIDARRQLNQILQRGLSAAEATEVRSLLTRLANETVFSARIIDGDPLTDTYTIQSGDRLVRISPRYKVPHEIIMTINGVKDAGRIRAGQRIKVPRGPFHAKIDKSEFRLDLYLGDTFVRSYRVGLGDSGSTPEGTWQVKNRLENPTYYPPASAPDKRIIPPHDPENPLGEHWIGLEGVKGEAVGREGYGIHGTIEPESIGKNVSMGCVRLRNEDVAFVYQVLQPGESTVTIVP